MDIVLAPASRYRRLLKFWPLLLVLPAGWLLLPYQPTMAITDLQLTTVQQGPLQLTSISSGELFSKQQLLLTTTVPATVTAVLLRPGSPVEADSVLLQLANPQLDQQVQGAARAYQQKQAVIAAFTAQQQQDLLLQQDLRAEREAALAEATLELDVHLELEKRGVVSKIELRRTRLKKNQTEQSLQNAQARFSQFSQMQQAQQEQQQLELSQLDSEFRLLQSQQQQLTVKAGISGIVQQLDVEIGQSLTVGAPLARIGSQHQLNARIYLAEKYAAAVKAGSEVELDLAGTIVRGQISRLEAMVVEGMVAAEVEILEPLPASARPAQRLRTKVSLQQLPEAIYLEQPPGSQQFMPNQSQQLFVKTSVSSAEKRLVQLGDISGEQVLITAGLQPGEQVILNIPEQYQTFDTIKLL
ncbi:HlyD family efflux transporter periplasmic adaptor subunit [Rheinheimera riviphila]|uniref:HlyD family efflux transporter periplasmic adaptor subunit n=1 Tax=Rheinheimera riviphila TaxID=1834037 RepID=A0A437QLP7_9GAMM|nr:HlyD family efflux transporter periplasmic adaptor subunit [Rheinheimera riviphila]RVU35441.1 HlyD family efflux transporter periplasmic adaptor subunit [Rheinheimera riviphila]